MYTPGHFAMDDPADIAAHIVEHPLATLVASLASSPSAMHLPLLYDARLGILRDHLAQANEFFGVVEIGAGWLRGDLSENSARGDTAPHPSQLRCATLSCGERDRKSETLQTSCEIILCLGSSTKNQTMATEELRTAIEIENRSV